MVWCMHAPSAHRLEDEMECSSRGKRERGTKGVAVKLQSKKVDRRLIERSYSLYKIYWSINKRVWKEFLSWALLQAELRITVDPVNFYISNSKGKGKIRWSTSGVPLDRSGHSGDQIFHASWAKPWHNAAKLRTLSVPYPLCGSALILTPLEIICLRCAWQNSHNFCPFL